MRRILALFPSAWDRAEFASPRYAGCFEFILAGPDRLRFPRNLSLLTFNVHDFIENLVARHGRARIDGVVSTDDMIGVAVAAIVARRLGLPGPDPAAVIRAQHKYCARLAQQRALPEATPAFALLPARNGHDGVPGLAFPLFLKPVKGTYSAFTCRVDDPADLKRRLSFGLVESFVLRRLTRPFNDLLARYAGGEHDANRFLGEQVAEGAQVTLDGFVHGGRVEVLGVVDAVMFPGTHTFRRFEYPSRLSAAVHGRMTDLARRLIESIGFDHGPFNIEMTHDPATAEVKIIEMNPRLSPQFSDLYEKVDGTNTYDALIDLALGRAPVWHRAAGRHAHAASFVLRTFRGSRIRAAPGPERIDRIRRRHPDARVMIFGRPKQRMTWEMRALGSYRCAVINLGAASRESLDESFRDVEADLPFAFD